ncbi:MAG TPA: NAD(P)-binding domain-containing protein [Candidatus Dormibacteraeota bacterium]|nr:NAD(P)-binding domain-containing protein [Candidatus Dormibacteraeota bacterium]
MACLSRRTVAVIGAGPYGVSIAAHLQSAGMDFRIFGRPMYRWLSQMPKGMFLKSEGCASSLSDPTARHTLARHCAERGLPYGERGAPVSLEVFTQYALSFQRALAPNVEEVMVDGVEASGDGFELRLANGATVSASKVIVATGLEHAAHIPPVFAGLPSELLSHSADHPDLKRLKGRDVTVIGGGQSALEAAALLSEEGATVRLVVRNPLLAWNPMPRFVRRSLYERLRRPVSNLGQGLELWACCAAPTLFHHLPQRIRFERVKTVLGPAGAWWLKDRVVGRVQTFLGHFVRRAEARGDRAVLQVAGQDGQVLDLTTDHVIAATGYRFDLQRLPFLSQSLKSRLHAEQRQPLLSSHFESSVPGLYFTGLASASCFGPAMRFLHGADYTARRVSQHIFAGQRQYGLPPAFQCARTPRCKEF